MTYALDGPPDGFADSPPDGYSGSTQRDSWSAANSDLGIQTNAAPKDEGLIDKFKRLEKKFREKKKNDLTKDGLLKGVGRMIVDSPVDPFSAVGRAYKEASSLVSDDPSSGWLPDAGAASVIKGYAGVPQGIAQRTLNAVAPNSRAAGISNQFSADADQWYRDQGFTESGYGEGMGASLAGAKIPQGGGFAGSIGAGAGFSLARPVAGSGWEPPTSGEVNRDTLISGGVGGLLGGAASAIPYVKPTVQKFLQKVFRVTEAEKATAAQRAADLARLNETHGTNLEMTAGQLSGNPSIQRTEARSESVPLGLSQARRVGNQENLKMLQSRASRSAAERDATPYRNINDLVDAVSSGDKNAARILRDIIEPAGANNEKILSASREANLFPLKQRNDSLWSLFREQGTEHGPINMEGVPGQLKAITADIERVIGPEDKAARIARSVTDDLSNAQKEIFPGRLPDQIYEGFTPSYPKGGVGEFLSGARGAETMESVPGSVRETLQLARSPFVKRGVFQQPNTGVGNPIEGIPRWERPPSNSTALNAGNLQESISRLKAAAQAARDSNPRLAGELDQIVSGIDTRFETAVSTNPRLRAALDAARADTKGVLKPVEEAGTATSFTGRNGERIKVPEAVALEDKGLAAVRNLADEEALQSGRFVGKKRLEGIDPNIAATILEDPALNQYYSGANAEERRAVIDILRATSNNLQGASSSSGIPEAAKMLIGGTASIGTAGTLGPLARLMFKRKFGKNMLLENPNWNLSDTSQRLVGGASRALGESAVPAWEQQ